MTDIAKENTPMAAVNLRELSLKMLLQMTQEQTYSHLVIQNILRQYQYLDKRERAFLTRLTEGTIEYQLQSDYIINCFSNTPTEKMKPVIKNILRMGVYQIFHMDQIPSRAICDEAVKLAQKKGFHNLKGFVNGILRNIIRNKEKIYYPSEKESPVEYLSIQYSLPVWIVNQWIKEYGYPTAKAMAIASLETAKTTIRCNQSKITVSQLKERLKAEKVETEEGIYLPYALQFDSYDYIAGLSSFQEGFFQVQDESSMLVAHTASIKENDFIVDICAAPGGKSLHAAECLKGTGRVLARDRSEYKVSLIEENRKRMGYTNMTSQVFDALYFDEKLKERADIVLADLPCSGLGIMRRKNDIKYNMTPEKQKELQKLQRDILSVACRYVKPGGILIYSTCTVSKRENEEQVQWITENYHFQTEPLKELPDTLRSAETEKGMLQLYPGIHKTDGFFIARLRKGMKT